MTTVVLRIRTVHEKMDRTQYLILCPQFRPTQETICGRTPASPAYFSITLLVRLPANAV